jgi:hypothetical protein
MTFYLFQSLKRRLQSLHTSNCQRRLARSTNGGQPCKNHDFG